MCTFEDGLCKDWLRSKATMKIVKKGFHLTKLLFVQFSIGFIIGGNDFLQDLNVDIES